MNATVLFADVSGAAISNCIEPLRKAAESAGGRVVKLVGDEVMVLFATPDAAAKAAVKMHQCIESLPAAAGDEPALRVAFHSGPVIQVDKDVLGDTVKLAARLAWRKHCTLEAGDDEFFLLDHSTNGTYVTVEGEHEILLNGEGLALATHGWIAFGHPHGGAAGAVEFSGS